MKKTTGVGCEVGRFNHNGNRIKIRCGQTPTKFCSFMYVCLDCRKKYGYKPSKLLQVKSSKG